MPKRKSVDTEEEKWRKNIKKYESKLNKKRKSNCNRVIYSSDEERDITEDHLEYDQATPVEPAGSEAQYCDYVHNNINEDQLEDEPAILAVPAASAGECTDDPHVDVPSTPSDTAPKEDVSAKNTTTADVSAVSEDFDPELLRALGEFEADAVEWGENIHDDIAKHFQHILLNGLKKEAKEELNKKYLFPKNVPLSKAPTLNPEIAAMLTEACRNRDKRILAKQEQIGRALSGLGKAMTTLLKKESNTAEVIRTLNDVGKLVADAHFAETDTRRSVVIPLVEKSLIDPFKDRKRDGFLFGEKLSDLVKSSRGIKKTGQLIQATSTPSTSSSSLNWKAPPAPSARRPAAVSQSRRWASRILPKPAPSAAGCGRPDPAPAAAAAAAAARGAPAAGAGDAPAEPAATVVETQESTSQMAQARHQLAMIDICTRSEKSKISSHLEHLKAHKEGFDALFNKERALSEVHERELREKEAEQMESLRQERKLADARNEQRAREAAALDAESDAIEQASVVLKKRNNAIMLKLRRKLVETEDVRRELLKLKQQTNGP